MIAAAVPLVLWSAAALGADPAGPPPADLRQVRRSPSVCSGASADRCTCEQERAVAAGQALQVQGSVGRSTEAAWRAAVGATCAWAERVAGGAEACVPTTTCVRLTAESRLLALSTASPAARAAELQRVTGRVGCAPGSRCAGQARDAEEERLRVVLEAVDRRGLDPRDPHRYWLAYRDLACEAEAERSTDPPSADPGWIRDACSAVLTHRRAEELVELLATSSPADADPVAEARLRAADRAAGGRRIWARWLDQVEADLDRKGSARRSAELSPAGPGEPAEPTSGSPAGARGAAEVRELVREALEARADDALFPPLLEIAAWTGCDGSGVCLTDVAALTRAQRDAVAPPLDQQPLERSWRRRWCGRADLACEATIDLLVAAAHER